MGRATSGSSSSYNQTTKTTFDQASPEEQALRQQFADLGASQLGGLQQALQQLQTGSAFQLRPQDQALIDQAYNSAQQQLDLSNKDYADYLSGGRGLRMSDTPISQQAMQRQALGQAELGSQKANATLGYGLAGNQFLTNAALGLGSAVPAGSLAAFNPLFQERMSSGTTTTSGFGNQSGYNTRPLMDSIMQGLQGAGQLAAGIGTMGYGLGPAGMGLFGGAGGAGASGALTGGLSGVTPGFSSIMGDRYGFGISPFKTTPFGG